MSDNFDFSGQNINQGEGSQLNQGNVSNPSVVNKNSGDLADWEPPFVELAEKVEDQPWPDATPSYISEEYETPRLAVDAAVQEIKNDLESSETFSDEVFEEKKATWADRFEAMLPMGIKLSSSVGIALADHFTKRSAAGVAAAAFFKTLNELA